MNARLRLPPLLRARVSAARLASLPAPLRAREEWAPLAHALGTADAHTDGRRAYLSTVAFNLERLDVLDRLLAAAAKERIALVPLKGAALARTHYGDPGLRPMADVDVLCAPGDRDRALGVARAAGLELVEPERFRAELGALHDVKLRDGRVVIELHHRLWHELSLPSDPTPLVARAREVEADGARFLALDDADHLFFVLVHASLHGFAGNPLWLLDALLLAAGDARTWARAEAVARELGALLPFCAARDHLALVFPDEVSARGGPAPLRRALLRRLGPWLQRGEPELGLLPSRIVRPLLIADPIAFARWAAEKAAMLRGRFRRQ